jgi:poly(hydroxyalkanoate) granule-associated protein
MEAAMAKRKNTKKVEEMDVARKIWLAGVGAYGRAYTQAQDQIDKLTDKASDMFDELVAQGEKVEDEVRARIGKSETGNRLNDLVERAQKFRAEQSAVLEERVAAVRKTIGEALQSPVNVFSAGRTIAQLNKKIDALTAEVAALKKAKTGRKAA